MNNLKPTLRTSLNEILVTTNLSVSGASDAIRIALADMVAEASQFEKAPFKKPQTMSLDKYNAYNEVFVEMRNAYFNSTHDIFSFIRIVGEAGFNSADSELLTLERLKRLANEVYEEVGATKSFLYRLFKKQNPWITAINKITNSEEVPVEVTRK